jgi:hypothetical protein
MAAFGGSPIRSQKKIISIPALPHIQFQLHCNKCSPSLPTLQFCCVACPCQIVRWQKQLKSPYNFSTLKGKACNRPWRPIGLWDVEDPTFSRQSTHRWRWGCQPYAPGRSLPPGKFLVLISLRGSVDSRAIVRLQGLGQLKNPMTSSWIEPATFRLVA